MQPLATADQMQKLDRTAIKEFGIPGLVLMENAGRAFVDELSKRVATLAGKRAVICCGKGNNGGDGFVAARHLLNRNCAVTVALLCKRKEVKGDAKTNLDVLFRLMPEWKHALKIVQVGSASQLRQFQDYDVVVDAIFGTGFKGAPNGVYLRAIQWINNAKGFVAAVDISSGVNASTGAVDNEAVRARMTVTMGLAKVGQFVGAGREHSGEVTVVDITIPNVVIERGDARTYRVTGDDVRSVLPKRMLTAHKYGVGKVFVLAGSRKYTGAPFLCAQAAMRAGAGAVILGTPKSVQPILARKFTEVILAPLEETPDGSVSASAYEAVIERMSWADVIVIGPGISRSVETAELILRLIPEIPKPLVLDADALFAIASKPQVLLQRKHPTILTPHTGELGEILGQSPMSVEIERVETARRSANQLGSIICLKGSPTVTATPVGKAYLNSTGNPGMATIGSGDVLTGMVASLVAQGTKPEEAAYSSVYIHGLAGDISAARLGQRSLMAMDILNDISNALKMLETT